ncbi:AAA family ATPase [Microvirga sp. 0TCS3.31]
MEPLVPGASPGPLTTVARPPVVNGLVACDDRQMVGRLVGREAELDRIAGAVVSARGGTSRCLLVTGEAGIGKSRLVAEAVQGLRDVLVLTGHAADMTTGEIPFGVVADTLRDLARVAGGDVLLPAEREALAPLLPGAAPRQQVERVQLLSTFLDLLERLAGEQLVVWVVEDLHWADSATRDLVGLTARTLPAGLLIVATVRTEDPERAPAAEAALTSYVAGLARTPGCEVLPLSRLGTDAVQQQLRDLLGSRPSADVANRVERLSDGIPFVVEELVAAAGRPELTTAAAVASGRLDGLSSEARRLVEAASVGDGHLRVSLLEQVIDVTPEELDAALAEALRAGIVTVDHDRDSVGFRHALLREATDRQTGPGARRSWHRRWAEVLEDNPGVLAADPALLAIAEHWHQAGDVRRALAATVVAMPAAERVCLPGEEAVLWTRVMRSYGVLGDAEDVAGMTLREAWGRGLLSVIIADRSHVVAFEESVPIERMSGAERVAVDLLADEDQAKGEANLVSSDVVEAAVDAFDEAPVDVMSVAVWASAGSRLPDLARGRELIARSLTGARALGVPRAVFLCASMGSYQAQRSGDAAAGASMLRQVLSDYPDEAWPGAVGCIGNLVWCEAIQGRHIEAQAAAEDGFRFLTRPHLAVQAWEHVTENAAFSWLLTGDWSRARAMLEQGAPWWDDDVRSSSARLGVLDLVQRGATDDVHRWWPRVEDPAPGGAPRCLVRELLARAAVLDDDLTAMRSVLMPAWTDDRVLLNADELWCTAVFAARAEGDAALAGRRDDHTEASPTSRRSRRSSRLSPVWVRSARCGRSTWPPSSTASTAATPVRRSGRPWRAGNGSGTCPTRLSRTCRWRSRRRSTAPATPPATTSRPGERSRSDWRPRPCSRVPTRWRRGGRSDRANVVRTAR